MSEKIKTTQEDSENSDKKVRFPEDPNQYTEEELMADPAKRYHLDEKDFPIFSQQGELGDKWGEGAHRLSINETAGRFVKFTADTIAVIAGEDVKGSEDERLPAADHVIYLDKSARPVSWLVNVFWDDFTNKPRPKHSYLAIDRMEWFARTETPVDQSGYIIGQNRDAARVATFEDLRKNNISDEDIARVRALFIPGGIEEEDVETIMNTPTGLEGKNITIVDEVSRSGATLKIAQYLVSRAIPEAASVNGYTFWTPGYQISHDGSESQMRSVPVWYDAESRKGRGIGDVNESFFAKRYEEYPNPKTRAQKYGALVLGEYLDLSKEAGNSSRELAKEILTLRKEWDDGHILMSMPSHYDHRKWAARLRGQGVVFVQQQKGNTNLPKNSFPKIKNDIAGQRPQ